MSPALLSHCQLTGSQAARDTHRHSQEGLLTSRLTVCLQDSSPTSRGLGLPKTHGRLALAKDSGTLGSQSRNHLSGSHGHACYFKLPKNNNNTNLSPR